MNCQRDSTISRYTTPALPLRMADLDFSVVSFFRVSIKSANEYESQFYLLKEIRADAEVVDAENHVVYVELTQQETAAMQKGPVVVQVRYKLLNGKVDVTDQKLMTVEDVLDQVVI